MLSPLDDKRKSKHELPSGTRQGALVGGFVGLVHGGLAAGYFFIILYPVLNSWFTEFVTRHYGTKGLSILPTIWNIILAVAVVGVPVFGVIAGAVLGVLFVAFKERLPGGSIIRKSVFFSLILVGVSLISLLRSYFDPRVSAIMPTGLYSLQLVSIVITAVEYPFLGYLFGYLLNRRLKPK